MGKKTASTKKTVKKHSSSTLKAVAASSTAAKRPGNNGRGKNRTAKAAGKTQPVAEIIKPRPVVKTTLTAEELEAFREQLLAKRNELLGDLAGLEDQVCGKSRSEAAGDLSLMPIHMADIGSDNYEQDFAMDLLQNESKLLEEIDQALGRIAENTYGMCLATGKPIGKTRLKFKPWAKYSVRYVRSQEKNNSSR